MIRNLLGRVAHWRVAGSRRRKAWVLTGLVATALVPAVLVQSQASATNYFCVKGSADGGDGQTMAAKGYPAAVDTSFGKEKWGSVPGGDTALVKGAPTTSKIHRIYHPDKSNQRECMATAAAPCVVTDTVTVTEESWVIHNWKVEASTNIGTPATSPGLVMGATLTVGYGGEVGKKKINSYALSNMVPYKTGTTVIPAGFTDYKAITGKAHGGFFKVGVSCRADGEFGEQYVFEDKELASWTAEEYEGSGSGWMTQGDPTEKWL